MPEIIQNEKKEFEPFKVKTSEEIVVAISQYKTYEYTNRAIKMLKKDKIPFTTIILFDGISEDFVVLEEQPDYAIVLKNGLHSLTHIWNMMFGFAKLLPDARYLLWQGSDMEFKEGSFASMYKLISSGKLDVISPIKIDGDREKFDNWMPISSNPYQMCTGINDSAAMFRLDKLPFIPFDNAYAPYQFETSALGYELWNNECKMAIDLNAAIFHHCSKDIEHSPIEREHGSKTWDMKRDYFVSERNSGNNAERERKKWFLENSIMNSESVKQFGFPVHINRI